MITVTRHPYHPYTILIFFLQVWIFALINLTSTLELMIWLNYQLYSWILISTNITISFSVQRQRPLSGLSFLICSTTYLITFIIIIIWYMQFFICLLKWLSSVFIFPFYLLCYFLLLYVKLLNLVIWPKYSWTMRSIKMMFLHGFVLPGKF